MFLMLQQNKNVLLNVLTSFVLSTKKMNKQYDFKKCKGIISISFDLWKNIKAFLLTLIYIIVLQMTEQSAWMKVSCHFQNCMLCKNILVGNCKISHLHLVDTRVSEFPWRRNSGCQQAELSSATLLLGESQHSMGSSIDFSAHKSFWPAVQPRGSAQSLLLALAAMGSAFKLLLKITQHTL